VRTLNQNSELSSDRRFVTRKFGASDDCSSQSGARWYAIHTFPRREFGARSQLEAQSYTIFLPRHLKTVRHARQLKTIDAPFFPRYLFVRLDLSRDRWRSINGTLGVVSIIMNRDWPIPVPEGIVEALQARLEPDATTALDDGLRIGQRVEVMVGPFANLAGELERFDGKARVRVLLQLMGSLAPVSVDRHAVVPTLG
jgi:transcription elongation factor/antiterminator RfaH